MNQFECMDEYIKEHERTRERFRNAVGGISSLNMEAKMAWVERLPELLERHLSDGEVMAIHLLNDPDWDLKHAVVERLMHGEDKWRVICTRDHESFLYKTVLDIALYWNEYKSGEKEWPVFEVSGGLNTKEDIAAQAASSRNLGANEIQKAVSERFERML